MTQIQTCLRGLLSKVAVLVAAVIRHVRVLQLRLARASSFGIRHDAALRAMGESLFLFVGSEIQLATT